MQLGEQVELVRVDLGPALAEMAGEEVADRLGGDAAVADRGREQMRTERVAAGEVLRHLLDLVDRVDRDRAAAAVEPLQPLREIGHLADRRDDHVAFDLVFGAVDRLRDHALHRAFADAQRPREALLVLQHFERHHAADDLDALALGVLALALGRGHLLDREERGENRLHALAAQGPGDVGRGMAEFLADRDVVRVGLADMAETARDRGDVDRGVAAADHDDAHRGREHPAAVERVEEVDAGDAILRVRAGDRQRPPLLRADRPEDRVEIALELLDRHVAPDLDAAARLDVAEREDPVDLGVEHVARRAVAGDAEAHHAAELVVRLEDHDRMALVAQEMRRREAGRAAADHRDLLAGQRRRGRQGDLVLDRPVADILLDRVDADEIVDLVAVAAVLARRRADAAHHGGKRIGLDHAVEGVVLPRHAGDRRLVHAARDGEPAADVVARGAAALAGRRAMDVGRALVGVVGLEDLGRQVAPTPTASCRSRSGETSAFSDRLLRSLPSSP